MRRTHLLPASLATLMFLGGLFFARGSTADTAAKEPDPWAGAYLKYAQYDSHRKGQFGEALTITITKDGDGYRLSKPYDTWKFTEIEKGVLSDGGHLGKLYLGHYQFADGKRGRVLRADFCYEWFVLWAGPVEEPKKEPRRQ